MQLKWPMLWDLFSLFPAYAGVIPVTDLTGRDAFPFPRIRGGDPVPGEKLSAEIDFSPHTRG